MVEPKADIMHYVGISERNQAGTGQGDIYFLLISLEGRFLFKFKRLQTGADLENRCGTVLDFGIVNDGSRRTEIGVGPDLCCALLSANVVGSSLVGFN